VQISVKAPDDCFANASHEWGPHVIKCRVGVAEEGVWFGRNKSTRLPLEAQVLYISDSGF
ncbi:hypothetical protein TorRG33x02_112350, partial [Trema orientale]